MKNGKQNQKVIVTVFIIFITLLYLFFVNSEHRKQQGNPSQIINTQPKTSEQTSVTVPLSNQIPSSEPIDFNTEINQQIKTEEDERKQIENMQLIESDKIPPEFEEQVNNDNIELPEDLRRQLESEAPVIPPDLQEQLEAPVPEIPDDIKEALETPPQRITEDEVNKKME